MNSPTHLISMLVTAGGVYLLIGLIFGIAFVFFSGAKVDRSAVEATFGFKLLIIPGTAIFWPILLKRWLKRQPPPKECTYHRREASK